MNINLRWSLVLGLSPLLLSPAMSNGLPSPLISQVFNAPNPVDIRLGGAEGQTRISYTLAADAGVRITLFDLFGQTVRSWTFAAGDTGGRPGENALSWDGTNERGQKVSKGGYLAVVQVDGAQGRATLTRKIGVIH